MDPNSQAVSKVTVPLILERKLRGEKITCLTAYDYSFARLLDEGRNRNGPGGRLPRPSHFRI